MKTSITIMIKTITRGKNKLLEIANNLRIDSIVKLHTIKTPRVTFIIIMIFNLKIYIISIFTKT